MNELDTQGRSWLRRLGFLGLGSTLLTLIAGLLTLIGASQPGFDGVWWLIWGLAIGASAVVWTVVVVILALIGLALPDVLMFDRTREDISAILFVNLNLVSLWLLATVLIIASG